MRRLFTKAEVAVGGLVPLEPKQVHYLRDVLRLSADDDVILADEAGREFRARLARDAPRQTSLLVVEELAYRPEPKLAVHLLAGLMKGKKMERLVRDASDLGVTSLTPFVSSRTVPRDVGEMKLERMNTIAVEEARLSGRNRPLVVLPCLPFREAVRLKAELSLMLWEEETTDIRRVVRRRPTAPASVSICSGPEGGFSAEEADFATQSGAVAVGLGRRIIRAETAPLVAAAIVQYEWGDL